MWSDESVRRYNFRSGVRVSKVMIFDLHITLHLWRDKPITWIKMEMACGFLDLSWIISDFLCTMG